MEPSLKYHPFTFDVLTMVRYRGLGQCHGGQFDWGGLLPKSNGGVPEGLLMTVGHRAD